MHLNWLLKYSTRRLRKNRQHKLNERRAHAHTHADKHTCTCIQKLSPFTYHCKRICFSGGRRTAVFLLNKSISISSGSCSVIGEIDQMSCFGGALKHTPTTDSSLTSPTYSNEIQMPKSVPLKFCNCTLGQSLLSEVLLGLLFSALKPPRWPCG